MKEPIIILLTIALLFACSNDTPTPSSSVREEKTENQRPSLQVLDSPEQTPNVDDSVEPDIRETAIEQNKATKDKQVLNVEADIIDRDGIWLGDPFEDPDYIGTPCGDYINGRCSRHHHHKYDDIDLEQNKADIDSLKYNY